jgi:glycosyltransferase involved in cell wall biosynthesis
LWGLKLVNRIIHFPSNKNIAGWAWKFYGKQSCKFITEADIFHVRSGAGQGGAIIKAKANGMKVIVDHSIAHPAYMDKHLTNEYLQNGESFDLGMDAPLFKFTDLDAKMADCVLVNSFFVKETFLSQGFCDSKMKVVYLGVREDFFNLKKDYSSGAQIKLLFTGGFGFRKGAEYLLRALQILEKEGFSFEMKIVGNYKEAEVLMAKYPIKAINYIGFVPQDELKNYLKEADIYVFPSLSEGCASSAMEALAAGLPTIATVESGLPIENEKDGILIPSKNSECIVSAIKKLANDKSLRTELGKNAALKISTNYTWEHYAENLLNIYKEILVDCK